MKPGAMQVLSEREWILSNDLGGYALGFGNMINKRKYNGLLIASAGQLKRVHVLASIEEKIEFNGSSLFIDSNHYPNCIYPEGYKHIVKSWLRPYPSVLYAADQASEDVLLLKEIMLLRGKNAVAIKYTNKGKKAINLVLRPKFTLRDHHMLNAAGTWDYVKLDKEIQKQSLRIKRTDTGVEAFAYIQDGEIKDDQAIYRSVYYPVEAVRGYEAMEDLVSPACIRVSLYPRKSTFVVFSSEKLSEPIRDAKKTEQVFKKYPLPHDHPKKVSVKYIKNASSERKDLFDTKSYVKILELAARDFIVHSDDIVAGYPWFGNWSRDTLISMSGFKYLPTGSKIALRLLKQYGEQLKNGMLPNTFGEGGKGLNYDSVDAPLWYVLRCYEYGPQDKKLFENVCNVVLHYMFAESNPFFMADDGLIEIRQANHALTWMDAKVYGVPVTPRCGKPVEINALWFNALCAMREMAKNLRAHSFSYTNYKLNIKGLEAAIEKVWMSLQKFKGDDFLADRLENGNPVWEKRPNAIIALSLPFDFVEKEFAKKVWNSAKKMLLTQYGLRSLDPDHPAFKQKYIGSQKQRDLAYHQGTVWGFLLLPFAKLAMKVLSTDKLSDEAVKEVSGYVWAHRDGFIKGEIASVAEVWDGHEPYMPKGCPAQAWSVFALLEIESLLARAKKGKG